eukprot:NODE_376_length_9826_cov_0.285288.p2 type:complete len:303 gc:universal NODE_376_length_9826_cov_0.285288:7228-8136(+)
MIFTNLVAATLNDYIVQYQANSDVEADIVIGDFKASLLKITDQEALKMHKSEGVKSVEKDSLFHTLDTQESPISWGLDRIDSRSGLDSKYVYPTTGGAGVTVYVIDTGINVAHDDFEGRATFGYDATGEGKFDGNGHGSHVAGTIGGKEYGVAKKVDLVAVKVLTSGGSGTNAGVLKGIQWAYNDSKKKSGKTVGNMSLGGGYSKALNDAIAAAVKNGLVMVVAAGNDGDDSCKLSPASAPDAITVAAVDRTDTLAYFSSWGSCVDIAAPGVDITSVWKGSSDATKTISGTSMASPHVVSRY